MDPMMQAIGEAFGGVVQASIDPLIEQIKFLTADVRGLRQQQAELLAIIAQARAKGGFVGKMLG